VGIMTGTGFDALMGALIFLAAGIIELALIQRYVYPALRARHERAKLTGSQGSDPARILTLLRIQSLIFLPILGFVLGGRFRAMIG
jgi:hypothetical protein